MQAKRHRRQRAMRPRAALAALLACILAFSPLAAAQAQASPSRETSHDLCALWRSQSGSTAVDCTITGGGTYALTSDLAVSASLVVNAPGQDVVIDLGSFTFESTRSSATRVISVQAAKSVTIRGSYAQTGADQLVYCGAGAPALVYSEGDKLVLDDVGLSVSASEEAATLGNLGACGVYAARGEVVMTRCSVTLDYANQTKRNVADSYLKENPRGIYLSSKVSAVRLAECSVNVTASPVAENRDGASGDFSGSGYAFALYSLTSAEVIVQGGSYEVSCARGSAICLCTRNVTLENAQEGDSGAVAGVSLAANGAKLACGVYLREGDAACLDAHVSMSFEGESDPSSRAAFYSEAPNALTLGEHFVGSELGVMVKTASGDANEPDTRIATCAPGGRQRLSACASYLTNGDVGNACSIVFDDAGLYFSLDESDAPVWLVSEDGTTRGFASVSAALRTARSSDVVQLRADMDAVSLAGESASVSYTLDLNGHTVGRLSCSGTSSFTVESSVAGGAICGNADTSTLVAHSGSGTVFLSGVRVEGVSVASALTGVLVEGEGSLVLHDVDVAVYGEAVSVCGVKQASEASGSLSIEGGSISAITTSEGVAAYGISAGRGDVSVTHCPITVRGAAGLVGGIDFSGSLGVAGAGGQGPDISVCGIGSSLSWGVRALSDGACAELDSVCMRVKDTGDDKAYTHWCLLARSTTPDVAVTWSLIGRCSFESTGENDIGICGEPISLDASCVLSSDAAVCAQGLEEDCFARGDANAVRSAASHMHAATHSAYEGWSTAAAGEQLRFDKSACVRNETRGTSYASLAEAARASDAGDVFVLTGDAAVCDSVVFHDDATLDLSGHTLSVVLDERQCATSASALSFSGRAHVTNGSMDVSFLNDAQTSSSDANFYAVAHTGSGSLSLDDVSLHVAYAASKDSLVDTSCAGVYMEETPLSLSSGTHIAVRAEGCRPVCSIGVKTAVASDVDGAAAQVKIERGCTVDVDNNCERAVRGSIDTTTSGQTQRRYWLMEFSPDENSQLYSDIQRQFRISAKADFANDAEGNVYGAGIYYATPLTLDDGSHIWAFSDSVSHENQGRLDAITAAHFYAETYYDDVPDAFGLYCAGARLEVAGTVSAASDTGNAYAIAAQGECSIDESLLSVSCSQESYRAEAGDLDIAEKVGLSTADSLVYPNSSYTLTEVVRVSADKAPYLDLSTVRESTGLAFDTATAPDNPYPAVANITFEGVRLSLDDVGASVTRTCCFEEQLPESEIPCPDDFRYENVTYRFIGWRRAGTLSKDVLSSAAIASATCDGSLMDATGSVRFAAVYVPVAEGRYLAVFDNEGSMTAYGVSPGEVPSYRTSGAGISSATPKAPYDTTYSTWGFLGWQQQGDSQGARYSATLPRATGDVVYRACYTEQPNSFSCSLYRWISSGTTYSYAAETRKIKCGSAFADAFDDAVWPSETLYREGEVYALRGYSTRRSDRNAFYNSASSLPPVDEATSYFAVYQVRERVVDVSFYVDGDLYATAGGIGAAHTVNAAFAASDNPQKPGANTQGRAFRGWSLEPDGKVLTGAVKELYELVEAEEPLALHAVYYAADMRADATGGSVEAAGPTTPSAITQPRTVPSSTPALQDDKASQQTNGKGAHASLPHIEQPSAPHAKASPSVRAKVSSHRHETVPSLTDRACAARVEDSGSVIQQASLKGLPDVLSGSSRNGDMANPAELHSQSMGNVSLNAIVAVVAGIVAVCFVARRLGRLLRGRRELTDEYFDFEADGAGREVCF